MNEIEINSALQKIIPSKFWLDYLSPLEHFNFNEGEGWQNTDEWQPGEDAVESQVAACEWLNSHVGETGIFSNHSVCTRNKIFDDEEREVALISSRFGGTGRAHGRCECGHEMIIAIYQWFLTLD